MGKIVPGGSTGQESIYNGLTAVKEVSTGNNDIVLIHDGVRPLIKEDTITENIETVKKEGNCITCVPVVETIIEEREDGGLNIPPRDNVLIARAPQSFYLKDILGVHERAIKEGKTGFIDSCSMMNSYGFRLAKVIGPMENFKITSSVDYFLFKAMVELHENQQLL